MSEAWVCGVRRTVQLGEDGNNPSETIFFAIGKWNGRVLEAQKAKLDFQEVQICLLFHVTLLFKRDNLGAGESFIRICPYKYPFPNFPHIRT